MSKRKAKSKSSTAAASKNVLMLQELAGLEARLLPELPLPVTLWLDVPGAPVQVLLTTAPIAHDEPVLADHVVFDRDELCALIAGAQSDRLWRRDLLGFCFEKWRSPRLRISRQDALMDANPNPREDEAWTFAQVLSRLGATLTRVELSATPSEAPRLSVAA